MLHSKAFRASALLVVAVALVWAGLRLQGSRGGSIFPFAAAANRPSGHRESDAMLKFNLPKQRVRAPEFPKDFAWVNTDKPLYINQDLKGRVVVLDFWTYCCINCMHILPDLEYIEQKYAGQPVVIVGVHSAKFDNEQDRDNIRQAVERYNIAHPVIVDERHRIWSEYGVNSWPTLMVIDPEGKVVGSLSGEGNRVILDEIVSALLEEGKQNGTLAAGPPVFHREGRVPSASGLAFPGKVLAEPSGKFVFISDSNHDRVIIADPEGNVVAIAGSGEKGNADGAFDKAQFANPQGLAYDAANNLLYVADTDNHLIRKLDLNAKSVQTIAGTGKQVYDRTGGANGTAQGLNSPWDLALVDWNLYIAMAGNHQIWSMDLRSGKVSAWVGSGAENIDDGTGLSVNLAQPSGLTRKGDWLYFADSEVSALRRANLKTRTVETLIGSGLFDFGDRTGSLRSAKLQHPLGVAVSGDDILVADTYNHKVKRVNEAKGEISAVAGTGKSSAPASDKTDLSLYEPGGLSARGDTLYIADTNHDRIIEYNLAGGTWHEFALKGLRMEATKQMDLTGIPLQEVAVKPGMDLVLRLNPEFPRGVHLNKEAPINYAFVSSSNGGKGIEGLAKSPMIPVEVRIPASAFQPGGEYQTTLNLAYCTDESSSICVPVTLGWRLKFVANPAASNDVPLTARVKPLM
ncbi:MAG TPA: thioredoxin-like domain-containing protein [bacterium]|jgi:thiol-disulfide isomerase/thioredoxin